MMICPDTGGDNGDHLVKMCLPGISTVKLLV